MGNKEGKKNIRETAKVIKLISKELIETSMTKIDFGF